MSWTEVLSNLAGLRDRALLLVGFVGALGRSELARLQVSQVGSKTNQTGQQVAELVVLVRAGNLS